MKKIVLIIAVALLSVTAFAQDKNNGETQKPKQSEETKISSQGEILLDALHLEAIIEKPSVSIVPKRIEPDLEEVEFINRKFNQEVKVVPAELFSLQIEKNRVQKIRDIDSILKKARD